MTFVRTMFDDISPKELGFTYSHEHIVCVPPYWEQKNADDLLLDSKEKSMKDVLDFKENGGKTIVDATAVDYGRRVEEVAQISRETDVHIIGTAGFNKSFLWDAEIPEYLRKVVGDYKTYTEWIDKSSVSELADFMISEIEEGLEGTHYKAGQVKFGTGYNSIKPLEIKVLKAAAIAHKETGAPIHSHTEAGTMALEQIELLKAENIDISNLSIGHMDRNLDYFMHQKVAEQGAFLCFDGMGKIKYAPETHRIEAILELVDNGFEDQILISGDTARKSYYKHYDYGLGLEYIIKKWTEIFTEISENKGYDSQKLLNKFFELNPQRCFTFKK